MKRFTSEKHLSEFNFAFRVLLKIKKAEIFVFLINTRYDAMFRN